MDAAVNSISETVRKGALGGEGENKRKKKRKKRKRRRGRRRKKGMEESQWREEKVKRKGEQ